VPGALSSDRIQGATAVPQTLSYRMMAQQPVQTKSGTVRIVDSRIFPASTTIAAALVEVNPGGMRELHWHPNTDEWQYYIEGEGRMGVFGASGQARTFDFRAGDVGYVPFAMGHYIENTGSQPLRFLEMFKSSYYADLSLDQWIALTPPELVEAHLRLDRQTMAALRKEKKPVVPA
jgi:oxalate decarboxylase